MNARARGTFVTELGAVTAERACVNQIAGKCPSKLLGCHSDSRSGFNWTRTPIYRQTRNSLSLSCRESRKLPRTPLQCFVCLAQHTSGGYFAQTWDVGNGLFRGPQVPRDMQQSMQRWMAWFKELNQNGHIKDQGQPLEHPGKVVKGKQKTVTRDCLPKRKTLAAAIRSRACSHLSSDCLRSAGAELWNTLWAAHPPMLHYHRRPVVSLS